MAIDKKLFLIAAAGVLLAGMKSNSTPPRTDGGGGGSGGGGTGGGGSGGGGSGGGLPTGIPVDDPILGAIKGAIGAGATAGITALVGAIKTAVGGGTAAAGGGAAVAQTTASSTTVTISTTSTGGGGTAGGAGGAAASGGAIAGGIVGGAASIAVAVIVVIIVIVAIIVISIFVANITLKNAIGAMSRNGAIDLHLFELELFDKIRGSLTMPSITRVDVQDPRMNGMSTGTLNTFVNNTPMNWNGVRATFQYNRIQKRAMANPAWMGGDPLDVAMLRLYKQIRALSLEYINYRARLLDKMGNGFYPDIYGTDFATRAVNGSFAAVVGGIGNWGPAPEADWGGFENFPLLDGQTEYSIAHPESGSCGRPCNYAHQAFGPREWFVARESSPDLSFATTPLGEQLLKAARLKALCEVVSLFAFDPTVVFAWEGYMPFVVQRLQIGDVVSLRAPTTSEPWNAWTFYTDPSFFGACVAFDVWMIRVPGGNSRMFKRNAGVPLGDKRLGATWIDG